MKEIDETAPLPLKELCKHFPQFTKGQLYNWMRAGKIKCTKPGKDIISSIKDVKDGLSKPAVFQKYKKPAGGTRNTFNL